MYEFKDNKKCNAFISTVIIQLYLQRYANMCFGLNIHISLCVVNCRRV